MKDSSGYQSFKAKRNTFLKSHSLNDIPHPFWENWYIANIHSAITPDILHQLYQGVVKHLVEWLQNMMGDAELDVRIKCLPPAHGVRQFSKGVSGLTQVSGSEHKDICKQLLACLLNTPSVPSAAGKCSRALLDFLYLAQYPSHSDATLKYLQNSLDEFHKHKDIFLHTGARLGALNIFSCPE